MLKRLLATAGVCLLPLAAHAADLPSRRAPAPVVAAVPVFTWTGFYVGAQVGYGWGKDDNKETDLLTGLPTSWETNAEPDGVLGGIHAGYNYQMGSFVIGLEGDAELANLKGDAFFTDLFGPIGDSVSVTNDFRGSVRARLGVAFDRLLVYATGGIAIGNFKHSYYDSFDGSLVKGSETRTGWTVGGGVEYAFTNNLTGRVEYRYTDFGKESRALPIAFGGDTVQNHKLTDHTVRAGLSYKFSTY